MSTQELPPPFVLFRNRPDNRWIRIASMENRHQPNQPLRRTASSDGQLRLYAMTCGWLSADISLMLERGTGHIKFPIPVYLTFGLSLALPVQTRAEEQMQRSVGSPPQIPHPVE
jgi:hypothetical protein